MGKTVKVTCDGCGADLTTRSNSVDYRLVLSSESKTGYGAGAYTDMMIYPPVERTMYFCALGCLDHWRDREHHIGGCWKQFWDGWKAEHGTTHGDVVTYPQPGRDVTGSLKKEFEDAALAIYPMKHLSQEASEKP